MAGCSIRGPNQPPSCLTLVLFSVFLVFFFQGHFLVFGYFLFVFPVLFVPGLVVSTSASGCLNLQRDL